MAFSTEETLALRALRDGVLRLEEGAWWIVASDHAREVSARLVQGLRGEGLLEPTAAHRRAEAELRLTDRGRRVAEQAAAGLAARGAADERGARTLLAGGPLALLRPAADSEEVDYLLAIRLGVAEIGQHRQRLERAHDAYRNEPASFGFVQYRTEVAAVLIGPAAKRRGLLPTEGTPYLVARGGLGRDDTDALGARGCPDRGVNYGPDAVQWFGGFGEADPLITTPRLARGTFEAMLREAEALASVRGGREEEAS
ncbi:MAG: hypothetical protein U5K81_14790 [Trueperaceae bacterium]|nr:hypothetical protein [Trueperaceae bacterium]